MVQLKDQLKECKVDLLSSISESNEYIQLINAYPNAKDYLKTQYHNSCEQSSNLLGKIKAINTLLQHLSGN